MDKEGIKYIETLFSDIFRIMVGVGFLIFGFSIFSIKREMRDMKSRIEHVEREDMIQKILNEGSVNARPNEKTNE